MSRVSWVVANFRADVTVSGWGGTRRLTVFSASNIGASSMTAVFVVAVLFFIGYLVSLKIHPLRKCPVCKMTGRHFGGVFTYSYRRCRKCNGTGRMDRWGTQAFFGGTKHTGVYPKK